MLTLFFCLVDLVAVGLGIFWFDYQPDGIINNPLVIVLSILAGFVVTFIVILLFLDVTYLVFAKGRPNTTKIKHFFGRQIVGVLKHVSNVRTTVTGREYLPKDGRFIVYSNHTSELDIPVLKCNLPEFPIAFLAKEQVRRYPGVGKWAETIGCVMLDRENNRQGTEAIAKVIANIQSGSTMVVFPEGTFVRAVAPLLKFRSGAFKIALESRVPLVPISLVKEADYHKKRWPRPKHIDIVIHQPIPYDEFKDLSSRQLSMKVREIIGQPLPKEEPT